MHEGPRAADLTHQNGPKAGEWMDLTHQNGPNASEQTTKQLFIETTKDAKSVIAEVEAMRQVAKKGIKQWTAWLRPDIFDDGSLNEQPMKKPRAFMDVGDVESMSKGCWGAAKWVLGQARTYCVNGYSPSAEVDEQPIMSKAPGNGGGDDGDLATGIANLVANLFGDPFDERGLNKL